MKKIQLTVQPCGNGKFRFGISREDSHEIFFDKRHFPLKIRLDEDFIETKTSCGYPNNKGFDLYHFEINRWIISKNYHNYKKQNPSKLNFILKRSGDNISLDYAEKA